MFYLTGSCKWVEEENILKFLLNRNSVVKTSFESPVQSNRRTTVTLGNGLVTVIYRVTSIYRSILWKI